MKDSITLYLQGGTWLARFDGPHGDEVAKALGTRVVPTSYTSRTLGSTVQAMIGRLNPGVAVYLA